MHAGGGPSTEKHSCFNNSLLEEPDLSVILTMAPVTCVHVHFNNRETIAAIEANDDILCLQKRIEKFSLLWILGNL